MRDDRSCVLKVWKADGKIIQAYRYAVFSEERNPEAEEGRVSLLSCSDEEEEVCIQEADGRRVGKILWVIPMIGKSENIFFELIVIC